MDQDRGKDFRRKKHLSYKEKEEKPMKRPIILMKSKDNIRKEDPPPQTILLKTRDSDNRAVSPQTSVLNKDATGAPSYQLAARSAPPEVPANPLIAPPIMKESVKFLEDNSLQIQDNIMDFLTDSTDFLVVGCLGLQSTGKSTLMSHLISPSSDLNTSGCFKPQTRTNIDTCTHCTQGIDIYVTPQRVILLDTQPILSLSVMSKYYLNEGNSTLAARSCSRDDPDYPCVENDIELLSLQYASFLLSVCHVVLIVQDHIIDPELSRFIQIAEMLKPSTGTHSEEELIEYFPHVAFVHTKTKYNDFTKEKLKYIQETYKKMFDQSRLVIQSGIGIANGSVLKSLTPEFCGCDPINVFLLPPAKRKDDPHVYELGSYIDLVTSLRQQINGLTPTPLTNTVLSEKNWFYYASKIWDTIKKSQLFPEYGRLFRTSTVVQSELESECPIS